MINQSGDHGPTQPLHTRMAPSRVPGLARFVPPRVRPASPSSSNWQQLLPPRGTRALTETPARAGRQPLSGPTTCQFPAQATGCRPEMLHEAARAMDTRAEPSRPGTMRSRPFRRSGSSSGTSSPTACRVAVSPRRRCCSAPRSPPLETTEASSATSTTRSSTGTPASPPPLTASSCSRPSPSTTGFPPDTASKPCICCSGLPPSPSAISPRPGQPPRKTQIPTARPEPPALPGPALQIC